MFVIPYDLHGRALVRFIKKELNGTKLPGPVKFGGVNLMKFNKRQLVKIFYVKYMESH